MFYVSKFFRHFGSFAYQDFPVNLEKTVTILVYKIGKDHMVDL